jgi:hypothetical protein
VTRLITNTEAEKSVIYDSGRTRFIEGKRASFDVGLNPHCAVKDLWSKEREKKDNRSSGLG